MRNSKKRDLILKTVYENRIHGTAEQIYNIVKLEIPEISLGTVYRNLQQLSEQGLIRKLTVSGSDRFDGCTNEHAHLICDVCGQILDIDFSPTPFLSSAANEKLGFCCTTSQLIGRGLCADCLCKAQSKKQSSADLIGG